MGNQSLKKLMGKKRAQKRGYSIAIIVGFDEKCIHLWEVFSESIKKIKTLTFPRKWKYAIAKEKFHFYEEIISNIRPLINKGLKSILLANSTKIDLVNEFLAHINKHYRWLIDSRGNNQACFDQVNGNARNILEVKQIIEQEGNLEILNKITSQENFLIIKQLEKAINKNNSNFKVFYGLKEIETIIYEGGKKDKKVGDKIDYLLITDEFLSNKKLKNRIYRLKQIAENKGILSKIIPEESPAGDRIQQFGGILGFKKV